jgi:hypothetical protein
MKINRYLPFAFIYFFLNTVGLPFGLTYTALLAPLFYVWILVTRKKEVLLPFLVALAPFIIVQLLYQDIVRKVYFISLLNLLLLYIFCQAVYTFLKVCKDPEKIFRQLLYINFIFCLAGIIFYFTPFYEIFWYEKDLTLGVSIFRRLKLLTYEPSLYATMFTPIFCFYFLQYLFKQNIIRGWKLLTMLFLPFLLSLSYGVMGALIVSAILVYIIYFVRLAGKRRILNWTIFGGSFFVIIISFGWFFFRNSPLVLRVSNIFSGQDLSGKGKTIDSFIIANKLIEDHKYFGIGLGQIKIRAASFIQEYYLYIREFVPTIPNAVAETWAIFGWTGMLLRIFIEIFLFFHTKVWTNYYRLWLFFFIFIYQFTGSFITNIAEYVIWILAFTNVFTQFDVKPKISTLEPDIIPSYGC